MPVCGGTSAAMLRAFTLISDLLCMCFFRSLCVPESVDGESMTVAHRGTPGVNGMASVRAKPRTKTPARRCCVGKARSSLLGRARGSQQVGLGVHVLAWQIGGIVLPSSVLGHALTGLAEQKPSMQDLYSCCRLQPSAVVPQITIDMHQCYHGKAIAKTPAPQPPCHIQCTLSLRYPSQRLPPFVPTDADAFHLGRRRRQKLHHHLPLP